MPVSADVVARAIIVVNEQKQRAAGRGLNIKGIVNDINTPLSVQMQWNDLLYAVPNCLQILGICAAVASSDGAQRLPFTAPASGNFQQLNSMSPKGALLEISDLGNQSFLLASKTLDIIGMQSQSVKGRVSQMLQVLQAPDEPMSIVIGSFQDVKRTSSECKERARALYDALAKWSTAVEEFWEHFTPEAAVVEQRQKAAEQKLSFGGKVPKGQVERPGEVQKSVKHMEESTMVPSIFQDPDAESRGSSKLTGDDAEQYVRAATSKLATTQEQCKSASEQLAALEAPEKTYLAGLTSARNELAQFQVQRVNPDNLCKALIQCLGFAVEFKLKVARMVELFSSVSTVVDGVINGLVKPFQSNLQSYAQTHPDQAAQFKYNASLRDPILQRTIQVHAGFTLGRDVADLYKEVSQRAVMKGLQLVRQCQDPGRGDDGVRRLGQFAERAAQELQQVVQKKQDDLNETLKERLKELGKDIETYPAELRPAEQDASAKAAVQELLGQPNTRDMITGGEESVMGKS